MLDADAADGLQQEHPEITAWYMAGHSLGGAMAANYVAAHYEDFDGLILLAATGRRMATVFPLFRARNRFVKPQMRSRRSSDSEELLSDS